VVVANCTIQVIAKNFFATRIAMDKHYRQSGAGGLYHRYIGMTRGKSAGTQHNKTPFSRDAPFEEETGLDDPGMSAIATNDSVN